MGLLLHTIVLAPMATNCYLLGNGQTNECIVVDPAAEIERILAVLERKHLTARLIVVTHGHPDHAGAVVSLKKATGARFGMHPGDASMIAEWSDLFGFMIPDYREPPVPDVELVEGTRVQVGGVAFDIIETPGHTPGGICLYGRGVLLSGDTLFRSGIGRYDLPGGDGQQLLDSIHNRLLVLPDDTRVYPGHGEPTTIGWEKCNNPFLTDSDLIGDLE